MIQELSPILMQLLKFLVASVFLVFLYGLLLKGKTSYNQSRLFLLLIPVLALLLSQFHVPLILPTSRIVNHEFGLMPWMIESETLPVQDLPVISPSSTDPVTTTTATVSQTVSPVIVLVAVYLSVTGFLFVVFIFQFLKILKLKRRGLCSVEDGVEVVVHPDVPTPFSFYKTIYLNESASGINRDMILRHEKWHIRHLHYIDVLLMEVFVRLFWFNPVLWWVRQELEALDEYQADRDTLDEGVDIYQYQTLILEEVVAKNPNLVSGLNDSFTKKRFIMMKQKPLIRFKLMRRLLLFPLMLVAFLLLSVSVFGNLELSLKTKSDEQYQSVTKKSQTWDEKSNVITMPLSTYPLSHGTKFTVVPYTYKWNNDSIITKKEINTALSQSAAQLKQVIDEISSAYEVRNFSGVFNPLEKMLLSLDITIGEQQLKTITCPKTVIDTMSAESFNEYMNDLKVDLDVIDRVLASKDEASRKLQHYKLLVHSIMGNRLIWYYLSPAMETLARQAGYKNEDIVFKRVNGQMYRHEEPEVVNNDYVPSPGQLVVSERQASSKPFSVSNVKIKNGETYVTIRYSLRMDEYGCEFDKTVTIIDKASGEQYPILRLENGLPLEKSIVIREMAQKNVDITLVFPALKKSVREFDLYNTTDSLEIRKPLFADVKVSDYQQ
jgi:hypothetical protein